MTNYQNLVDRYLQIWNDPDPATRQALIDALFSADVTFVDPMVSIAGRPAVNDLITTVQTQFPGHVLTQVGTVDGHHSQARFGWEMSRPDHPAQIAGSDVVTLTPTGQINQVLGFLDLLEPVLELG